MEKLFHRFRYRKEVFVIGVVIFLLWTRYLYMVPVLGSMIMYLLIYGFWMIFIVWVGFVMLELAYIIRSVLQRATLPFARLQFLDGLAFLFLLLSLTMISPSYNFAWETRAFLGNIPWAAAILWGSIHIFFWFPRIKSQVTFLFGVEEGIRVMGILFGCIASILVALARGSSPMMIEKIIPSDFPYEMMRGFFALGWFSVWVSIGCLALLIFIFFIQKYTGYIVQKDLYWGGFILGVGMILLGVIIALRIIIPMEITQMTIRYDVRFPVLKWTTAQQIQQETGLLNQSGGSEVLLRYQVVAGQEWDVYGDISFDQDSGDDFEERVIRDVQRNHPELNINWSASELPIQITEVSRKTSFWDRSIWRFESQYVEQVERRALYHQL